MAQSYISWRLGRIARGFASFISAFYATFIDPILGFLIIATFFGVVFLCIHHWHKYIFKEPAQQAQPQQPPAPPQSSSGHTVDVQVSTDSDSESQPDESSTPGDKKSPSPGYVFEYIATGSVGISILVDRGTGCEYIEVKGQPLIPRMQGYNDNNARQDCDGDHDFSDLPDKVDKHPTTTDPNRVGYVEPKKKG